MIAGLSGFANGFADSAKMMKDKKQKVADDARTDRYLNLMEKNGGMGIQGLSGPMSGGTGGYGAPGGGTKGGDGTLFGLIDATEGGANYDTLFGHSQNGGRFDGVKVSEMTLGDLYTFSDPSGDYGQWVKSNRPDPERGVATPMGRHQIVGTTLRATADAMGLSPDTKFTPQIQDSMASYLARNRIAGLSGMPAKRAALRSEWQGFQHVSDEALDAAIMNFEQNGMGMPQPGRGIPA